MPSAIKPTTAAKVAACGYMPVASSLKWLSTPGRPKQRASAAGRPKAAATSAALAHIEPPTAAEVDAGTKGKSLSANQAAAAAKAKASGALNAAGVEAMESAANQHAKPNKTTRTDWPKGGWSAGASPWLWRA